MWKTLSNALKKMHQAKHWKADQNPTAFPRELFSKSTSTYPMNPQMHVVGGKKYLWNNVIRRNMAARKHGYAVLRPGESGQRHVVQRGPLRPLTKRESFTDQENPLRRDAIHVQPPFKAATRRRIQDEANQPPVDVPTGWKVVRKLRHEPTWDNMFYGPCHYRRCNGTVSRKPKPRLRSERELRACFNGQMPGSPFCKGNQDYTPVDCLDRQGNTLPEQELRRIFPYLGRGALPAPGKRCGKRTRGPDKTKAPQARPKTPSPRVPSPPPLFEREYIVGMPGLSELVAGNRSPTKRSPTPPPLQFNFGDAADSLEYLASKSQDSPETLLTKRNRRNWIKLMVLEHAINQGEPAPADRALIAEVRRSISQSLSDVEDIAQSSVESRFGL
jgi:hypothetical protein